MSSKEKILQEIKTAKPVSTNVIVPGVEPITFSDKKQQFVKVLSMIGGKGFEIDNEVEIKMYLLEEIFNGKTVITVSENENLDISKQELYEVDIAFLKGGIAVAENAAIWVTGKNMGSRILPFSCKHLIVLVEEKHIVNNMQEAYDLINIAEDGYGVFIAGPSKTADIEQSLVIGAHGPIQMTVYIINAN